MNVNYLAMYITISIIIAVLGLIAVLEEDSSVETWSAWVFFWPIFISILLIKGLYRNIIKVCLK